MSPRAKKGCAVVLVGLVLFASAGYFGYGYVLRRALESRGLRRAISEKTARLLDASVGYTPLASNGLMVSARGFLAKAEPPRALAEIRAAHLRARCNLPALWQGHWKIDNLSVRHLQAAYGNAAAQSIDRREFFDSEILPSAESTRPVTIDLRKIDIARTDLFWGNGPNEGGEFRDVHTVFSMGEDRLGIEGSGGTFRQRGWPVAQVHQLNLLYQKPKLEIVKASLTFGDKSSIAISGSFRFEQLAALDLQFTFARCPIGLFLDEVLRSKVEGEFDGAALLHKQIGPTDSARVSGSIVSARAVLQNIEKLRNVANLTGRQELALIPIHQINAEYDWNFPMLRVRKFVLESKQLVILRGEFTVAAGRAEGEFQLGVAPDLVDKFPGAREEVFKRSGEGYLWTELTLSGPLDNLRDNLKPRLLQAAQNYFAKGQTVPVLKSGQSLIESIESL